MRYAAVHSNASAVLLRCKIEMDAMRYHSSYGLGVLVSGFLMFPVDTLAEDAKPPQAASSMVQLNFPEDAELKLLVDYVSAARRKDPV